MTIRDELLRRLEQSRGEDVSGQRLAQELGVSRNAIWKTIEVLRREGYAIVSSTNRGYRLSPDSDRLSSALIQSELGDETLPVFTLATVDSTNEEAKRLLTDLPAPAFAVLSDRQTAGRGRRGRSFYSPPDTGLYMTLVMSPDAAFADVVGITSYAAVCVVEALRDVCGKDTQIKWVNDIFYEGRKVCGILTEAISDVETGHVSHVIIGVGLNLRQAALPRELRDIVGFLQTEPGVKNRLAAAIIRGLQQYEAQKDVYIDRYRRYSLVLGRPVSYERNGEVRCGTATDIDADGALLVSREDGVTDRLTGGEITLRLTP